MEGLKSLGLEITRVVLTFEIELGCCTCARMVIVVQLSNNPQGQRVAIMSFYRHVRASAGRKVLQHEMSSWQLNSPIISSYIYCYSKDYSNAGLGSGPGLIHK